MDKKELLDSVKIEALRSDVEKETETNSFWRNVPESSGGYVLTSRVAGV